MRILVDKESHKLVSEPPLCAACREDRIAAELMALLDYKRATIFIKQVGGPSAAENAAMADALLRGEPLDLDDEDGNGEAEDDGYLVTFVTDTHDWSSACLVFDARDVEAGPLAKVALPQRLPAGFHATWVDGVTIDGTAP